MISTFGVVFTTLQALRNGVIMWSDIFIGVVSSGVFAILLWAFALRRMPDKVEKVINENMKYHTGKNGNLSNEHSSLSNEHLNLANEIASKHAEIKEHTKYLYEDKLRSESQNIESVNIIRNLEYASKKIVDLEKEVKIHQEEVEKLTIEKHKLIEENQILLEELEEMNPKPKENMLQ